MLQVTDKSKICFGCNSVKQDTKPYPFHEDGSTLNFCDKCLDIRIKIHEDNIEFHTEALKLLTGG